MERYNPAIMAVKTIPYWVIDCMIWHFRYADPLPCSYPYSRPPRPRRPPEIERRRSRAPPCRCEVLPKPAHPTNIEAKWANIHMAHPTKIGTEIRHHSWKEIKITRSRPAAWYTLPSVEVKRTRVSFSEKMSFLVKQPVLFFSEKRHKIHFFQPPEG